MPVSVHIYSLVYAVLKRAKQDSLAWRLRDFLAQDSHTTLYFLNAHGVNMMVRQPDFGKILCDGDYVLRDGVGVQLAFRFLGLGATENLNGTDLIPQIIDQYKSKRIAIFGSSDDVLAVVKQRLEEDGFAHIVSLLHGFYADEKYIEACKEHKPDLVILCMGMPRQELLSVQLKPYTRFIICGGGWADFYSGVKVRAPAWVRRAHLEWVHRLVKEPRRLGKRYSIDILYYFYTLFRVWLVSRKNSS